MIAGPAPLSTPTPPAEASVPALRYHALDAFRAVMMLLGIWLHAVVAYSKEGGWPFKDPITTPVFDWTLGLIHAFRMPAFYLIAGFFSALLVARRGVWAFARNRAVRILAPFVVGWLILYPLVMCQVVWAKNLGRPDLLSHIAGFFTSGRAFQHLHPLHLWFLEYLLFLYAIALAARPLAGQFPGVWARVGGLFRRVIASRWRTVGMALVIFPALCLMKNGWLDDPKGFAPEAKIVLAYLAPFGSGWLLYYQVDLLPLLCRPRTMWTNLVLGWVITFLAFACHEFRQHVTGLPATLGFFGCAGFQALGMWGLTFGLMGLFLRFLERPIAWLRYLSDSSYWLYIAHMPALLIFQIALLRSGWPPVVKIFATLGGAVVVLLASYHFLVRPTWVGGILNGRRYSKKLRVES
jgi:peptidoglycan/LPS O-acetylase OafA/YrhL